jgi:UDP-N-acetylglucosamine--N-acetylmuramyl-(pentapeptide) pyrophosphoryl-undecaprenol N-acetylglucosamine transferase
MISGGNQQRQANSEAPVFLSAGGTGGHMFPAFALARALKAHGIAVALVTDARGAKYRDQHPDLAFHIVRAETLRPGLLAKARLAVALLIGTAQAFLLLKKHKPRVVAGFGGYPSFPAVIAAQALRIPTLIHEQNAVLGRANQLLAGGAKTIALALPDLNALPEAWRGKTIVTGNPVRAAVEAVGPYAPAGEEFRLLVLGGSQGAAVFSKVVPEAIGLLPEEMRKRMHVVQQCRAADLAQVRQAYEVLGVTARLESFIRDVPEQLGACHLLIARSGASTVSEAAASGRPALFVPYPHHADQQQKVNAQVLVRAGGALMLEEKGLTAQMLAKELEQLMGDPARLAAMAQAARRALAPQAAERLADAVINI